MMKMLDRIDEGKPLPVFGDGCQTYDFVYVNDVARANLYAAVSDSTDAFYNVGTGIGTSVKELAEILLDLTESDVGIKYEPEGQTFVTNRIGSIDETIKKLPEVEKKFIILQRNYELNESTVKYLKEKRGDIVGGPGLPFPKQKYSEKIWNHFDHH